MSPFKDRILHIVRSVPKGKVVSYGQVAAYAGLPRAAREVGWILNGLSEAETVPWWRVVNNKGFISIRGNQTADKELQKKLLEADGIEVRDDFVLDIERYRFKPKQNELEALQLDESYITTLIEKYGV
jgi:methylated-DNA-protein-cysteine methyltransferase-like protein